jgi:hypothetical protein
MKKVFFKLKAISDLIFIASSNTEGNIKYLDFIPGSAIFGAVANMKFDMKLLNNKIRFNDGHVLINEKISYKIPLVYHYKKDIGIDTGEIYNSLKLEKEDYEKDQFTQMRSGYMNEDLEISEIEFNYSQKSARDYSKGRSKKSQMYGFKSIPKNSEFIFSVTFEDEVDEEIVDLVQKIKYLGKSKRNEYGNVEIKKINNVNDEVRRESFDELILYFKSRVCLIDENGNPTYDLCAIHPKITKENIVYEKNKVRFYRYSPYNYVRRGYDSERYILEKGSVVVLKNIDSSVENDIKKGIGAYLNEGFGEVLINPWFLKDKNYFIKKVDEEKKEIEIPLKTNLGKILKNRRIIRENEIKLVKEVYELIENNEFTKWFSNIRPSQWGNIRMLADSEHYFEKIKEYISKGVKKWREDQIEKFLNVIKNKDREFIKLLANQMAKKAKK